MYSRIMVPLDGSKLAEQALPYASLLARAFNIPVNLLNIFDPAPPQFADPSHGLYETQITASFHDTAIDYLEGAGSGLKETGITVSCDVHEGNPADHIINEAGKNPNTLIAMATHGRTGVGRWVLGSVTDKVLHATINPLLITHAREEDSEASGGCETTRTAPRESPLSFLPHESSRTPDQ